MNARANFPGQWMDNLHLDLFAVLKRNMLVYV
jgi:hypothetical protein